MVMLAIAISLELVSNPVGSAHLGSPEFTDPVLVWFALFLEDIATRRYLLMEAPEMSWGITRWIHPKADHLVG